MRGPRLMVAVLCALCCGALCSGQRNATRLLPAPGRRRSTDLALKWSALRAGLSPTPINSTETQALNNTVVIVKSNDDVHVLSEELPMPRALISETDVELKREGSLDRANGREGKRVGSHARDHEHKKKLREKLYGRKRFPRVRFSTEEPRKINAPKDESYLINTAVLFQEIDANEKVAHTRANKLPPGNSSSETREKFDFQFTNTTDGIKSDSIDTKTVVSSVSTSYKVTESFPSNETIVKMVSKALNESPKNITTSLKKPDPLTKYQIKSNFSRRRNNFRPTTKPKQDNVEKVQNLTAAPAEKNSQLDYQELVTVNERGAEQKNVTQGTEVGSRQSSVRLSGQKEGISRKIIPLSSRLKNVVKIPPKPRQAPVPNTSSIPTTISTHVSTILPAETTTAPTVRRRFTPRSRTSVPRRFRKSNDTNKNVTASEKFQKVEASSNVPSTSSMPELQKKPRRSKKFRRKHKDTKTESKPDAETGKDVGVDTRPRLEPSISADRPDAPPTMPPVQKFVETAPTHDKDSVGKIIMVIRNENEYGRVDGMINKANSTENRKTQQIENNSNLRPHQRVSKAPIIDIKIESTANPSNSEKSVRKFKRRGSFPHSGIIVKAGTATVEKVVGRNSNIVQALSPISSLITLTTESNVVEAPLIVTKKPALPSQATISQPITTTDKVRAYTAGRKVSLFGADYPDEGVARVIASPMPASTNYSRTSNLNSVNSLKESQGILTNSRGRRRHSVGSDASKKQDDEQGSSNSSNVRRRRYFRPMVSHDLTLTSAIMMEDNSVDSSAKMSLSEESTSSLLALPSQQVAIVTVDEYQPSANAHPEAQPVRPMVGDGYKSGKGVIKNRGGTETREGAWAEDNQRGYYKKSGSAPEHHSAHQAEKDKDFKGFHESFVVEKNGRSREFFDEVDHINYHHRFNNAEKFKEKLDAGRHKGAQFKNEKQRDKFGKSGHYKKGHDHRDEKGQVRHYGQEDKYNHEKKYGKKDTKEAENKDDDGRHKLNGLYHGAHSIIQPWQKELELRTGSELNHDDADGGQKHNSEDDDDHDGVVAVPHFPPRHKYNNDEGPGQLPSPHIIVYQRPSKTSKPTKTFTSKKIKNDKKPSKKYKKVNTVDVKNTGHGSKILHKIPSSKKPKHINFITRNKKDESIAKKPVKAELKQKGKLSSSSEVDLTKKKNNEVVKEKSEVKAESKKESAEVVTLTPETPTTTGKVELKVVVSEVAIVGQKIEDNKILLQDESLKFGQRIKPLKRKSENVQINSLPFHSKGVTKDGKKIEVFRYGFQATQKVNGTTPEEKKIALGSNTKEVQIKKDSYTQPDTLQNSNTESSSHSTTTFTPPDSGLSVFILSTSENPMVEVQTDAPPTQQTENHEILSQKPSPVKIEETPIIEVVTTTVVTNAPDLTQEDLKRKQHELRRKQHLIRLKQHLLQQKQLQLQQQQLHHQHLLEQQKQILKQQQQLVQPPLAASNQEERNRKSTENSSSTASTVESDSDDGSQQEEGNVNEKSSDVEEENSSADEESTRKENTDSGTVKVVKNPTDKVQYAKTVQRSRHTDNSEGEHTDKDSRKRKKADESESVEEVRKRVKTSENNEEPKERHEKTGSDVHDAGKVHVVTTEQSAVKSNYHSYDNIFSDKPVGASGRSAIKKALLSAPVEDKELLSIIGRDIPEYRRSKSEKPSSSNSKIPNPSGILQSDSKKAMSDEHFLPSHFEGLRTPNIDFESFGDFGFEKKDS